MECRIKIQMGKVEIDYEGSEVFLKNELPDLIRTISEIHQAINVEGMEGDALGDKTSQQNGGGGVIQLSTNSIATKLGVKTGPELAVAAAAHITFVKQTAVFSRRNLLDEMKTATSFYKAVYRKNLSQTLKGLLKTTFNEPSTGNYALTATAKKELGAKLAQA